MSDAVQIALIAGTSAAAQTFVLAFLNYLNNRKRDRGVKEIHTLVNSQMGQQLLVGMVSARTLAQAVPTAENRALAAAAEDKYRQHQAGQNRVDSQNP
jgi:hypothetical protein